MKNIKSVWNKQCGGMFFLCCVVTAVAFIFTFAAGMAAHPGIINNWSVSGSFTDVKISGHYQGLAYNGQTGVIFIMMALQFFLQLYATLLVMELGHWLAGHFVYPLIVITGIAVNDSYMTFIPVFYRRFTVTLAGWYHMTAGGLSCFLWLLLIIAALYFAGYFYSGRKLPVYYKQLTGVD